MQDWPLEGHKAKAHSQSICKLTRRPFYQPHQRRNEIVARLGTKRSALTKSTRSLHVTKSITPENKNLRQKIRGGAKTSCWTLRPNRFIWKLSNIYFKKSHHLSFWHLVGLSNLMIGLHLYFHEHVHFGWSMFQSKLHTPWENFIHLELPISHYWILFFWLFF